MTFAKCDVKVRTNESQIATFRKEVSEVVDNKRITNNMRSLRDSRGLKQKYVASKLGITQNYYSQIENGHRLPQLEHLLILRSLYGISLDDIFFNNEIAKCDYNEDVV